MEKLIQAVVLPFAGLILPVMAMIPFCAKIITVCAALHLASRTPHVNVMIHNSHRRFTMRIAHLFSI